MNFTQGPGCQFVFHIVLQFGQKDPNCKLLHSKKSLFLNQHSSCGHLEFITLCSFSGTNSISVSDFSGVTPSVLVSGGLEEPRAIALHPGAGWDILIPCENSPSCIIDGGRKDLDLYREGGKQSVFFSLSTCLFLFSLLWDQHMVGLIILFCPHISLPSLLSQHWLPPAAEFLYSKM